MFTSKLRFFSPGTPISSKNKTDRHDITEILLKVALNIIPLTLFLQVNYWSTYKISVVSLLSRLWLF